MNKYLRIVSPVVLLISLVLILCFKSVPSGKLWKNYSVLYVPVESDDFTVVTALNNAEIKDYICLSSQYLPALVGDNSIEVALFRLNYNKAENEYISKRRAVFFDKSQKYRLYYIPFEYKAKLSDSIKILEGNGISCGTDSNAAYPWLLPFVSLLLYGLLFVFTKNKGAFASGGAIFVVFVYAFPFYPVAMTVCLALLCVFFIANVWKRPGSMSLLLSRRFVPSLGAVAMLSVFSASVQAGILFIAAAAGSVCALYCFNLAENYFRHKKSFVPVYIRSAKRVSLYNKKSFVSLTSIIGSAFIFSAVFFLSSSDSVSTINSKVLLPSSSSIKNEALPQMEEYYRWNWNLMSSPYKSLNQSLESDKNNLQTIQFPQFTENEATGQITQNFITMNYDESFRKNVIDGIEKLPFESVEKLMKSESSNFTGGYSASKGYQIHLFGIIMSIITLFILLFIYISVIIRKGINK